MKNDTKDDSDMEDDSDDSDMKDDSDDSNMEHEFQLSVKKKMETVNATMEHEFQLSVEKKMETVNARILNAPDIIYANRTVNVNKGTWQMQKFKQPINLKKNQWTIFYIKGNNEHTSRRTMLANMEEFMEKLNYHGKIYEN